jgi:hypothetical protein
LHGEASVDFEFPAAISQGSPIIRHESSADEMLSTISEQKIASMAHMNR